MPRSKSFSLDTALDTFAELFLERGYAALVIGNIGAAIGVSRSTIYSTFGTKAELFATLLDRYGPVRASGVRELRDDSSPRAALARVFEPESGDGAAPRCLMLDTIVKMPDSTPEVARLVEAAVGELQECFGVAIERGQAAGEIAGGVDPAQAAAGLLGLYLGRYVLIHTGAARESVLAAVARQAQALVPPPA